MAQLNESVGADVPTLAEVQEKIQARYAKAKATRRAHRDVRRVAGARGRAGDGQRRGPEPPQRAARRARPRLAAGRARPSTRPVAGARQRGGGRPRRSRRPICSRRPERRHVGARPALVDWRRRRSSAPASSPGELRQQARRRERSPRRARACSSARRRVPPRGRGRRATRRRRRPLPDRTAPPAASTSRGCRARPPGTLWLHTCRASARRARRPRRASPPVLRSMRYSPSQFGSSPRSDRTSSGGHCDRSSERATSASSGWVWKALT